MEDQTDSLLSPPEIAKRLDWLEQKGWPQLELWKLALSLASFCRGSEAEEALACLVKHIAPELLSDRIRDEFTRGDAGLPHVDYCGGAFPLLAEELTRRGFTVTSESIVLPDGTDVTHWMRRPERDDGDDWRCRLSLLGVLLLRMRTHPLQPSSY